MAIYPISPAGLNSLTDLGVSSYAQTILDDTSAGSAQTTLGISTFVKTILDDAAAGNVLTTLGGTAAGQALFTAATALAQANIVAAAKDFRGRNAIINGNFDIWQRGTSLGAASSLRHLADRWLTNAVGTTVAPSQQAFTLGQTDVPGEPEFFHRVAVVTSAGAGNYGLMAQTIEDVRTFAGQTATLSFYAKADAAHDLSVEFAQSFGTGGGPSATVTTIGVTKVSLTTSWQKFTVTTSVPSITGKTLGSDNNDHLLVNLWLDAGSDFDARTGTLGQASGTIDIAQAQLEAGSVATPFERKAPGRELRDCMRYYEASTVPTTFSGDVTAASTYYVTVNFAVVKRAIPATSTVTRVAENGFAATDPLIAGSYTGGLSVAKDATGTVAGGLYQFTWTADAEL